MITMYRSRFNIMPERQDASYKGLLRTFQHELEEARARKVTLEPNGLSFRGGLFRFMSSWNIFVSITKGRILLDPETSRVTYYLSFVEIIVVVTLMIGFMALAAKHLPTEFYYWGLPLMWLWLVGANLAFALTRFDRFMRRCIREAGFCIREEKRSR